MTTTKRFVLEVSVDAEAAERSAIELADELVDKLCDLPDELMPSWLFSVDGVDPAP